jgi:hypothetical protein
MASFENSALDFSFENVTSTASSKIVLNPIPCRELLTHDPLSMLHARHSSHTMKEPIHDIPSRGQIYPHSHDPLVHEELYMEDVLDFKRRLHEGRTMEGKHIMFNKLEEITLFHDIDHCFQLDMHFTVGIGMPKAVKKTADDLSFWRGMNGKAGDKIIDVMYDLNTTNIETTLPKSPLRYAILSKYKTHFASLSLSLLSSHSDALS